jgi:hypothetical protein
VFRFLHTGDLHLDSPFLGLAAEAPESDRKADKAADAHSPWLFWLTPDGRPLELFDVLAPMPPIERLPAEFVAMVETGRRARTN